MAELRGTALVAYLVVCVVWGSTYLAIRVGVAELPPFLFAGVRFLVAGLLLGAAALARGAAFPRVGAEWRIVALSGVLLLCGGNGMVVWAEQYVDSGSASIYVVTVAIWAATFDALLPGARTAFTWRLAGGLALGLLGTAVLAGTTPAQLAAADLRGPVALVLASCSWAFGSVLLKRRMVQADAIAVSVIQMLTGGAVLSAAGLAAGEAVPWPVSPAAAGALAYLVVFGSIVGFTAYGYALRHASATVVGTYAYVNPVVAVLLGWMVLDEALGPRKVLGMIAIISAVLWVRAAVKPAPPAPGADTTRREAEPAAAAHLSSR